MNLPNAKLYLSALLVALVAFPLVEIGLAVRDMRREIPATATQLRATLLDVARFTQDATGVTAEVRKTLKSTQDSNQQIAKNSADATLALNMDLHELDQVINQLGSTVRSVNEDQGKVTTAVLDTVGKINLTIDDARPGIQNLVRASAGAADLMNDPDNRKTLASLAATSDQMAGIATDAHTETGLIVGQTRKAFTPQNKFVAVMHALLGGTLTAAELVYYLTK